MLKKRFFSHLTPTVISMLTLVCMPFAHANAPGEINIQQKIKIQAPHVAAPNEPNTPHAYNATLQQTTELTPAESEKLKTKNQEQKTIEFLPEGWMQAESGLLPVYAGINGGTVALNVVHSNEGEIFALAGQTGNDFITILQGNSTPQKIPKVASNKTKENTDSQETGIEKKINAPIKKPSETIIASSQLASHLVASQKELLPFGLADTALTNELFLSKKLPEPALLALPKLKLGNYKSILKMP